MALIDKKISNSERDSIRVKSAATRPRGTAQQIKDSFDKLPELITSKHNGLIDEIILVEDGKEDVSNKVSEWSETVTDDNYPSEKLVKDTLDEKYEKPSGGIPSTDMTSAVQTSLGKADSALQEHQSLSAYRTSAAQDLIDATKLSDAPSDDKQYARKNGAWSEVEEGDEAVWGQITGTLSDQTDLDTALDGKADTSHTHTKSDVTDFSHNHTKSEVTDFTHTHTKSEVTDFAHTHTKSEVTDFAHTHDDRYYTEAEIDTALSTKADSADIPTKTSDLTNDSGFLTEHQSLSAYRTSSAQDAIDNGFVKLSSTLSQTIDANSAVPLHIKNKIVGQHKAYLAFETYVDAGIGYLGINNGNPVFLASDGLTEKILENTSNKVTSVSSASTDTQYPSAKCVYDANDEQDRKIEVLDKIRRGQGYDIDTNNETAYSVNIPSGAFRDNVLMIGGKSVVMNQLLHDFGTIIPSGQTQTEHIVPIYKDHVYCLSVVVGGSFTNQPRQCLHWNDGFTIPRAYGSSATYGIGRNLFIETCTQDQLDVKPVIWFDANSDAEISDFQLFDLTQMFGAGNEPSTVAEFKAMFPADYYAYNTGEVKSAVVNEVDAHTYNLWDKSRITAEQYCTYDSTTGTVTGTGADSTFIVKIDKDLMKEMFKEAGQHYLSVNFITGGKSATASRFFIDGDASKVQYANINGIVNLNSTNLGYIQNATNDSLLAIYCQGTSDSLNNIQLTVGSTAKEYKPYNGATISIPSAIQALDGYGQSNGTTYNYVDYAEKKYHYFGKYVDGVWTPSAETVTDISSLLDDDFLEHIVVGDGDTITFKNTNGSDYQLPVPVTNEYIVDLNEVI